MNVDTLFRVKENMTKYAPQYLSVSGIACILEGALIEAKRSATLSAAYESMNAEFARYKLRVIQNSHSNNWLKMHGYPMRRRCPK